ncbi:MAG: 50S ribosomal protein L34 [Planctomycetota bacterium]
MKLKIRKSNVKQRKQGFRARMKTAAGRRMINGRRRKGKARLTPWN